MDPTQMQGSAIIALPYRPRKKAFVFKENVEQEGRDTARTVA
jgi:hypothetical protein